MKHLLIKELMNDPKLAALCEYLSCNPEDLIKEDYDHYGLQRYSCDGKEYAIGTDEEADKAVSAAIKESIWAFNASFILNHCDLPLELEDAIKAFQEDKCEGANDALLALIEKCGDFDGFVENAVAADGRAHFLSTYDGCEEDGGEFVIYRIN